MQCPKCNLDNPDGSKFCKECGTQLGPPRDIPDVTKTIETSFIKLAIGTVFANRYEILGELGKGGMGEVYRVKDKKLDEEMALKVLKPEIAAYKGIIERFKNELKLARKIAHRNVCKMYDLNEEGETPFITMEYVKGEDLKKLIKKKEKLAEKEAIAIAKQVCEGLAEAHELGVVHRDLKPQNIMINEKGMAKVMDFGIARSIEAAGVTQTGVIIGTPDYISPEQADGEQADQRSDIYSLGVILYEMVTGKVPFKGDTALSVALKHKAQLPPDPKKLNPDISENLSRVILVCMEKDRERRYQTGGDLLSDLMNIEEGLPLGTKIRPRRSSFIASIIQRKLFIPALVAILAIAIVIIWQPWSKEVPSPILSDKPSLAILYFKNNTGDEEYDFWRSALSDSIITDLQQSKYIRVLSANQLLSILRKLNLSEAKGYAKEDIKAVADEAGVNHILQGSLIKAGETFRIDYSLQNILAGETIGSNRTEGDGEESIFDMVDALTKMIKEDLNLTQEQIAADLDKELGEITTSSLEAYKYYIEGRKYNNRNEFKKSIQFMKRAITTDPEFASAYASLADNYHNLGFEHEGRKYRQKAFELSDRLPDREKYLIQGSFYRQSEKTYSKAIEALEKLIKIYPDAWLGYQNLGWIYILLEQWDKAIDLYKVVVKNNPSTIAFGNLAWLYMKKGLYGDASDILQKFIEDISDNVSVRLHIADSYIYQRDFNLALKQTDKAFLLDPTDYLITEKRGLIFLLKGDYKKAEEEFTKLLEMKDPIAEIFGKLGLMNLYNLQGKFKRSMNLCRQILKLENNLNLKSYEFTLQGWLAHQYLNLDQLEEAGEVIEKMRNLALEEDEPDWHRILLELEGDFYTQSGSLDKAQQTADVLENLIEEGLNKNLMRRFYRLMGGIAYKRGNHSEAIEYYKKAISLYPAGAYPDESPIISIHWLAESYLATGELEKAWEEYEEILQMTYGRQYYGAFYAKSLYMLGKVYEQQDNTGKAIELYEKFLDLWKDADPGIVEIEDARKKLAGLKDK